MWSCLLRNAKKYWEDLLSSRPWTKEDDEWLNANYHILSAKELASYLGRTVFSVRIRASERGLTTKQILWSPQEDMMMKQEYTTIGPKQIGQKLGRTSASVKRHAQLLGLKMIKNARYASRTGMNNPRFRGFQEIPAHYLASMRVGARVRELVCEITLEDIWRVYLNQNGKCRYSGRSVSFLDKTASVDRIDSSIGYTLNNIQIVHRNVNLMKIDLAEKEFLSFIHAIVKQNA